MDRFKSSLVGLLCLTTLFLLGCGGDAVRPQKIISVSGIVTLKGQPAENVTVRFVPRTGTPGNGGFGITDASGYYALQTTDGEPGVPLGQYDVAFSKYEMPDGSPVPGDVQPESVGAKEAIPLQYTDAMTSKKNAAVTEQTIMFDFDL